MLYGLGFRVTTLTLTLTVSMIENTYLPHGINVPGLYTMT